MRWDLGEDPPTGTATLAYASAPCPTQHIPGQLVLSSENSVKTYSPDRGGNGMGSSKWHNPRRV